MNYVINHVIYKEGEGIKSSQLPVERWVSIILPYSLPTEIVNTQKVSGCLRSCNTTTSTTNSDRPANNVAMAPKDSKKGTP